MANTNKQQGQIAAAAEGTKSSLYVGSGVDLAKTKEDAIVSELAATPATDTEDDGYLKDIIEMYLKASETRFKHLLNGMENSTAAMLKHLRDAVTHLGDHIEQQNATATKEKANV